MNKISIAYPDTWLTISISVKNRDTWVEAFSGTMTEVGTTREYKYDFTEVVDTDYVYIATCTGYSNMSGTLYSSSSNGWLTTAEHDQLFAIWRSMWGGSGFSEIFKSNLASTRNEIIRKIEDESSIIRTNIDENNNEINSHLTVAKDSIIHTINQTETEICSDVVRTKSELKEDNVATRQLVRQKTKNLAELAQKQLDSDAKEQKMMEDIEEEFEELEKEDKEIEEEFENQEIEEIKAEFENQEKETK